MTYRKNYEKMEVEEEITEKSEKNMEKMEQEGTVIYRHKKVKKWRSYYLAYI